MIEKGDKVLVGWSGGSDSTFLLRFLMKLKGMEIDIMAGYFNHMLRGKESYEEEDFVRSQAKEIGVELFVERENVSDFAERKKLSIETAGRILRYNFYKKIANKFGIQKVALGHTATDNAEWVIMQLIRGKAKPLITGIPPVAGIFIRPLIECEREEIIKYLRDAKLPYFEDSSNRNLSIPRNFIRHQIFPLLKKINPNFEESLFTTTLLGWEIEKETKEKIDDISSKILTQKNGELWIDVTRYLDYNFLERIYILKKILPSLGGKDIKSIEEILKKDTNKVITLKGGIKVEKSYGNVVLFPRFKEVIKKELLLDLKKPIEIKALGWKMIAKDVSKEKIDYSSPCAVFFDKKEIQLPLIVRSKKEGDRIFPFGMKGKKKVKKIFIEHKIPKRLRQVWPIVCSGDEILWIPKLTRSNKALVTNDTKNILMVKVIEDGEAT